MTNLGDPYSPAELRNNRIFTRLVSRIGAAIMSAADDAVKGVTDQLVKAKAEIDAVIADLESQAVSPETLQRLRDVSQSLDDENPDAQPTPEPSPGDVEPAPDTPAPSA